MKDPFFVDIIDCLQDLKNYGFYSLQGQTTIVFFIFVVFIEVGIHQLENQGHFFYIDSSILF